MAKHTRIYTRTGDAGMTGLYSGARVPKNDARIEAYGTVDELNSAIGVALSHISYPPDPADILQNIVSNLETVQDRLFDLGAELATPSGSPRTAPAVHADDVATLEHAIDDAEERLETLDTFIHPGGAPAGAALHLARTICRRAERRVLALHERDGDVDPVALRYVNRLGDALFVWARATNAALGVPERRWNKGTRRSGER